MSGKSMDSNVGSIDFIDNKSDLEFIIVQCATNLLFGLIIHILNLGVQFL